MGLINIWREWRQAEPDTAAFISGVQIFISVIPPFLHLRHFSFLFASPKMSSSVLVDSFIIHGGGEREIVHLLQVLIFICHLLNEIHSHLAGIWWLTLIMTLHGDGSSAPGGSSVNVRLIDLFWAPTNYLPKMLTSLWFFRHYKPGLPLHERNKRLDVLVWIPV